MQHRNTVLFGLLLAQIIILWETVPVNRIIRSGEPIFFFMGPFSLAKTLALYPFFLQIS